jgi:hypothetical protein
MAYILDENVSNVLQKEQLKDLTPIITEMVFFEEKKIQKIHDKIEKLLRTDEVINSIGNSKYIDIVKLTEDLTAHFIERYGMSCRECVEKYAPDIKKQYSETVKGEEDTFKYFWENFFGNGEILVGYNKEGHLRKDFFHSLVNPTSFLDITNHDDFYPFQFYYILAQLGIDEGLYSDGYYLDNFNKYVYDYIHQ